MNNKKVFIFSLVALLAISTIATVARAQDKKEGGERNGANQIERPDGMPPMGTGARPTGTPPYGTGTPRFGTDTLGFASGTPRNFEDKREGIVGTVSAINGSVISILTISREGTTTATVDATGVLIIKDNATSSISEIQIGNMIFVQGDILDSTITAEKIVIKTAKTTEKQNNKNGDKETGIFGKISNFFKKMVGKDTGNKEQERNNAGTQPTMGTSTTSTPPIQNRNAEQNGFMNSIKKFFQKIF